MRLKISTFLTIGNLEWLDKSHMRCYILWRTIEEWGKHIYQWVGDIK